MKLKLTLLALMLSLGTVQGITITNPLSLQTEFLAGILNGQPGDSNPTTEQGYAQTILNLSLGQKTGPAGQEGVFEANTVYNYSGTITFNGGQSTVGIDGDGTIDIPAGWGAGLVKYDGQNAGYVLFVFGGQAATIPEFPYNLWTTNPEQYQASHVTLFRGTGDVTPNPTIVPEGGVGIALFGLLTLGMGMTRLFVKLA